MALPPSRLLLWLLLAAPLALLTYNYVVESAVLIGEVYYGGYVHDTGRWAAWALLAALAASPLRLSFPHSAFTRWYMAQRRSLGVASFAYASAHLAAYLARQDWPRIAAELAQAEYWTGWVAFMVFTALALTSNDMSVRRLGLGWKRLHRLVHPAAILVFLHWALSAFDPFLAWCHIAVLALLEGWRLFMTRRPRRVFAT
jgi:sulfoxide reductase heme-binding subunit YedZ